MLEHFFDELNKAHDNDQPAFISKTGELSYKNLIKKVNVISQSLLSRGFHKHLCAIVLPHDIDTCILILACLKAKVTFVSIDPDSPYYELLKLLLHLNPGNIISHQNSLFTQIDVPYQNLNELLVDSEDKHYQTIYADNEEAFVTLTSGSTSMVKGVVHTNYSLCEAITHVLLSLSLKESDRLLCTLSHPSNAFLRNMLAALIKKATFILGYQQNFENVVHLIEQQAPTHIRFTIRDLISFSKLKRIPKNVSYIKRCDCSGDVIPKEVIMKCNSLLPNGKLITSYAMSECGTIAMNNDTHNFENLTLTGKFIHNISYRLVDENEIPVEPEATGELHIKTSTLFKRYWNDAAATQKALTQDGWFKTGDLFQLKPDGYLKFIGRKKNIIIKNGKNINPEYIRQVILEWQEIDDCVVVGIASVLNIQEMIVYCSLKTQTISELPFKKFMQASLNQTWLPSKIYVLKELPRTCFGKIDQSFLRNHSNAMNKHLLKEINL